MKDDQIRSFCVGVMPKLREFSQALIFAATVGGCLTESNPWPVGLDQVAQLVTGRPSYLMV